MSDSANGDLSTVVSDIESKAERKERANTLERQLEEARGSLRGAKRELDDLEGSLSQLLFYRDVVFGAFDPDRSFGVDEAVAEVAEVVTVSEDELVDQLLASEIERYRGDISDAESSVSDVSNEFVQFLESKRTEWADRISRARELQEIIGASQNDFATTINWIETLINTKMRDPSNTPSAVIREWENATKQWAEHQELQDLSAYQETHDLSDDSIDVIQSLSKSSTVTLDAIDPHVLEELQSVDDLAESITLRL